LVLSTLETLNCSRLELNAKFLQNLHHGQAINEECYIQKMSIPIGNGGLWGGFIVVFWILKYLQHPRHVWNKNNG